MNTPRVYVGHIASLLRPASKALPPNIKGVLAALVSGTVWTRTVQQERGYVVPHTACALCGEAPDTLRHRVLDCNAVQLQRLEWGLAWLQESTNSEAGTNPHAFRGFLKHPADNMPLPVHEARPEVEILQPDRFGGAFSGHIFWDGSASKPPVPELARAAWAAVMVDDDGVAIARMRGTVPRSMPQTSQAAEVFAVCMSVPALNGPSIGYEDCLNVHREV